MTRPSPHGRPPRDETEALARLRAEGGRITSARRRLVELFFSSDEGVTADALIARLPQFDQSTIYRTLASLEHAGVVEHVHLGHGPATYRRAGATTFPVVCERCGTVTTVSLRTLDGLRNRLRAQHGFELDSRHFALTGWCTDCSRAGDAG